MTALQYPGNIVTLILTSSIASSGTGTFTVSAVGGGGPPSSIGDGSGRPFVVEVGPGLGDDEKILVASYSSGTFTPSSSPLGRGWDLTSPIAHSPGEQIKLVPDSTSIQDFGDHVYKTTRDDHTQYPILTGARPFTGLQGFNAGASIGAGGLSITAGGATVTAGGLTVVAGTTAVQALTATSVTTSAVEQAQAFLATLTGTNARFVGATNGAPVSGTYSTNDFAIDPTNSAIWLCTAGGTPGTWVRAGGGVTDLTWTALTPANGWANAGGGNMAAGIRRVDGRVYLRGVITKASWSLSPFTLPYAPSATISPGTVTTGGATAVITVTNTGVLTPGNATGGAVDLGCVSFDTL